MTDSQIPTILQMASLTAAAAQTLDLLASTGDHLAVPDAAEAIAKLEQALSHIARTINSDAVKGALPDAAAHLDTAVSRTAAAAYIIRQAAPAIAAAAGRPVDFPAPVQPGPPAAGGVKAWRPAGTRLTMTTPKPGGQAL